MNKLQISLYELFISYTVKFPLVYFILILIQYLNIFAETLNSLVKINSEKTDSIENFSMNINKISPIYIIQENFIKDSKNNLNLYPILLISGIIMKVLFAINYFFIMKDINSKIINIVRIVFVNYCFIFFTVIIEIFYLFMFNKILYVLLVLKLSDEILMFLAAIGMIITITYFYLNYIKNFIVMTKFKHDIEFHTDNMFGKMFNFFIFIMKILISLEINFQLIDNGLTKKASQLFNILKIFTLEIINYNNLLISYQSICNRRYFN